MTVKITQPTITIRELVEQYHDGGADNRVVAYGGRLNVRPAFQRAFVYEPAERNKVMQSVYNGLPLNSMYWAINDDGTYEVVDGQQRIISICQFLTNDDGAGNPIAINFNGKNSQTFANLSAEKQKEILDYKLLVYICRGSHDEKLEWFHTINIAGKTMTEQELRNADYTGKWLTDAKQFFSKRNNNEAINVAFYNNDNKQTLLAQTGETANRQELFENVLQWIINASPTEYPKIEDYMAKHCGDENADELITYYKNVIKWIKSLFVTYRKEMKGLPWGFYYNKYHTQKYDSAKLESKLQYLFNIYNEDEDGLKKNGFYEYVLSGDRTLIWHRLFSEKQQKQAYKNQDGKCCICHKAFAYNELEAHHKTAFADGGETTIENCQMLCHDCHAELTALQNREK
ncbi:MAG: DUF262 domain-containing protein [Alphaproteobacteria bacterium]|nr:DUF262 domain-containing protein [Alphaproteobacteria bacterium]